MMYIAEFMNFLLIGLGTGLFIGFGVWLLSWGVSAVISLIKQ
jgi:hypothetical protein